MNILTVLGIMGIFVAGVVVDRLWIHFSRGPLKRPANPIPLDIPIINEGEQRIVQLYLQEWQVIIETQMHFNDLILRFRSIVLTAFVTLIGAAIAIQKVIFFSKSDLLLVLALPGVLWVTAFVIDFGYYHRLLMGSVAQALKFDDAGKLKEYGLFGLTSCISEHVHPPTSKVLVFIYYFIPLISLAVLTVWKIYNH